MGLFRRKAKEELEAEARRIDAEIGYQKKRRTIQQKRKKLHDIKMETTTFGRALTALKPIAQNTYKGISAYAQGLEEKEKRRKKSKSMSLFDI